MWGQVEEHHHVFTDKAGKILGRVIHKKDGFAAYTITFDLVAKKNNRNLLGYYAKVDQGKKAVEAALR